MRQLKSHKINIFPLLLLDIQGKTGYNKTNQLVSLKGEDMRTPENENELDTLLSEPSEKLITMMKTLKGDISILGANGKMGLTLSRMAKQAAEKAGVKKRVLAVSRFSEAEGRKKLEDWGIETVQCDLLDRSALCKLEKTENVIFMAGRKFGTDGSESITWAMNVIVPANCAEHFKDSRTVAFSTGCVYPLTSHKSGGSTEKNKPEPVGEYAQSCLGRERMFEFASIQRKTPVLLLRLNYACDLRYGVLYDIGSRIWNNEAVPDSVGYFNIIWQGDANNYALLALSQARSPANIMNITGPEILTLQDVAGEFEKHMKKKALIENHPGDKSYLNNSEKAFGLFGRPSVNSAELIKMQAEWIMNGGKALNKPTHFEVNNGKF